MSIATMDVLRVGRVQFIFLSLRDLLCAAGKLEAIATGAHTQMYRDLSISRAMHRIRADCEGLIRSNRLGTLRILR